MKQSLHDITPETKVGDLLKNFPDLEQTLIDLAPIFKKLRNPVLRRTVARVTSLRQAAVVGNVSMGFLINKLRDEVGLSPLKESFEAESTLERTKEPEWVTSLLVVKTLDARPIIDKGGQPLERVMKDLSQLQEDQLYALITPFVPAPLIDTARKKGYAAWTKQGEKNYIETYFKKK